MTTETQDLLSRQSHFAFGENWAQFAADVSQAHINAAIVALERLVGDDLHGRTFLDIGCGSGIHALAALRLGAADVLAMDLDPKSVATAQRMLETHAPSERWRVRTTSVFDLDPSTLGRFDVVYSWGVLHHTGDLRRAMRCAAACVAPGGLFALALYRTTVCCGLWALEKRWYAKRGHRVQRLVRMLYTTVFRLALMLRGRSFATYVRNYRTQRGMDFYRDAHDWLGGWPYESISAAEVDAILHPLGFARLRMFGSEDARLRFRYGNNEHVYRRLQA